MVLPILSAILGILAFLPFDYFWIAGFIFLAPLFIFFIREKNIRRLIAGAVIFKIIFMSGTLYYVFEPITWGSSILIFISLPVAIFLAKRACDQLPEVKNPDLQKSALLFSLPFIWTFFDHFQARYSLLPNYITTAGNSLGSSPFLGLGTFGLAGLTFFAALIAALIAAVVVLKIKKNNFTAIVTAAVIMLLFAGLLISQFELKKNAQNYAALKNSLKIAAVSANEKFDSDSFGELKNDLLNGSKIDILILPEDILNNSVGAGFYQNLAKELNLNLNVALDSIREKKRFNSSLLIDNNGKITGIHDKTRLTFMGEYWPFKNWRPFYLDWLKKADPEIGNYVIFNPGNPYIRGQINLMTIGAKQSRADFASLICLEIHYPADLKKYKKMGAEFFINQTSYRWADIGLKHLLYLTGNLRRIESVWLEIPIVSSGVKDFAGVIMPDGKTSLIYFENKNKNYGLFTGEIRYENNTYTTLGRFTSKCSCPS
jgi:apolipoprotein N-acyltransferase